MCNMSQMSQMSRDAYTIAFDNDPPLYRLGNLFFNECCVKVLLLLRGLCKRVTFANLPAATLKHDSIIQKYLCELIHMFITYLSFFKF